MSLGEWMIKFLQIIFLCSIVFSQEPYGGYVLYTPGGMGNGGATSYLKDVDMFFLYHHF